MFQRFAVGLTGMANETRLIAMAAVIDNTTVRYTKEERMGGGATLRICATERFFPFNPLNCMWLKVSRTSSHSQQYSVQYLSPIAWPYRDSLNRPSARQRNTLVQSAADHQTAMQFGVHANAGKVR